MNDVVYVQKVLEQPNELEQQSVRGQPDALEQPRLLKQRLLLGALRALRKGDFSVRLPRGLTGIEGEIAEVFNDVAELNAAMTEELMRICEAVGKQGQIDRRARVPAAVGAWASKVESVNTLIADLMRPTTAVAAVIESVANGVLSQRILLDIDALPLRGEFARIGKVVNTMVNQLNSFASEVSRVAREVGTEGKLGGQAKVPGAAGTWKDLTDNVNAMAANLTGQVRNIAEVTTAVAKGDLSKKITVDVRGEILELKSTINTMVDQLNGFASEVSRVAREVGTEGKLGGQARVPGVAGTWKDLTDNVNAMAANLTGQVRNIADVTTAVAKGDLSKKITVDVRGEILELKSTINTLVDQLNGFASEVSRVAREVGTEGKLGGQARVPGVAGTWKDLTDNVNQLAANLTTQVRAIAEVATAVTKGDLTRSIMVEAMGEVAALKDNINEMIRNLKDTTRKNEEQDWLKTNLAKFSRMLQGQGDLVAVSHMVLSELAPLVNAHQGVLYRHSRQDTESYLELVASYASGPESKLPQVLRFGEGLLGQCAMEKKRMLLESVPPDYVRVTSALGSTAPANVVILPVLFEGEVKAVLELASLRTFSPTNLSFLSQLAETIGIVLNTIEANMRTSNLLRQSQSLTRELQRQQQELTQTNDRLGQQAQNLQKSETLLKNQQEELQRTNDELQQKAVLLSDQMRQVEYKNEEIELAKAALEEKAEQLALNSRYKSQFLANMSHELRTPLNSLLILAKLLSDNATENLTPKQIDYAQTIYAAGADLLSLISDILDLAKIESGTVTLDVASLRMTDLKDYVERTFAPTAQEKQLQFNVTIDPQLPGSIETDEKRLQQILKNLLSNAFKFTKQGSVELRMTRTIRSAPADTAHTVKAVEAIAFTVCDTGIGIPDNQQKVIFEAFQQADGTTSRHFGGTGLGLSISRELAGLLGGEITVESSPGKGSSFVFYLPLAIASSARGELAAAAALPEPAAPPAERPPAATRTRIQPAAEQAAPIQDDREKLTPDDRVVLIIEADPGLAETLLEVAREHGFKGVVAAGGNSGFAQALVLQPDAITLDLKLPDVDGWVILDLLKHNLRTRHIPVSVVSLQEQAHRSLHMGAVAVMHKGDTREALQQALLKTRSLLEREAKVLLVADGDEARRAEIEESLRGVDVQITSAADGHRVLEALRRSHFDCVVLGPELEDMSATDLLRTVAESEAVSEMPFVVYETDSLGGSERAELGRLAEILVLKKAPTRKALLEEIAMFLHQTLNNLPPASRSLLMARGSDRGLADRKILIVDDDVRNVFALTGALEQCGMTVLTAEDGREGIEILQATSGVEAVLMDIMMPGLDGYDTIRIIREHAEFKELPIIAVTAKAMKGDREKCIDAGASDYIAKPVNVEQLTSLLRVWLNH
ncbi:MAG TPA: response regulator [Steroidobacteraceae bacterium]|nr:response regulator [Steroidobacteraceae bacterium]